MPNPFANGDQQQYQPQDPYQERQPYADPTAQDDPGYPVNYTPQVEGRRRTAGLLPRIPERPQLLPGLHRQGDDPARTVPRRLLFFWPIVPILFLIVVPIWAFVEFIMILVGDGWYRADANGVPLAS